MKKKLAGKCKNYMKTHALVSLFGLYANVCFYVLQPLSFVYIYMMKTI